MGDQEIYPSLEAALAATDAFYRDREGYVRREEEVAPGRIQK